MKNLFSFTLVPAVLFTLAACSSTPEAPPENVATAEDLKAVCAAAHEHIEHEHKPKCGHKAVKHDTHIDYAHEGHLDCPHDGHYDVRTL